MNPRTFDVIIVGAGLAGLSCARRLQTQGADYLLIEASDRVGGRVKTDVVKGFILNHGFQVLQTAYPEAQRFLDYAALDLKAFAPGAVFRIGGRFHTFENPSWWSMPKAGGRSTICVCPASLLRPMPRRDVR